MLRDEILKTLEQNRGKPVSGSNLAKRLGVSRTAVWKTMNTLREQGVSILSREGEGYTLFLNDDTLTTAAVQTSLTTSALGRNLFILQTVSSTNIYLKELAQNGAPHGTVVLSDSQTSGRGRMGREFYSPSSGGLYMSVLLRPSGIFPSVSLITASAAVAVADAIEAVTMIPPDIKWVNDIQLFGKKLCGILTEASIEGESGMLQYAVCGMGINISAPKDGYPNGLSETATALSDHMPSPPLRAHLAASILSHLERRYEELAHSDTSSVIKAYRHRLSTLGRQVEVIHPSHHRYIAQAIDITDNVHLIVERPDGSRETLAAGEISIRG